MSSANQITLVLVTGPSGAGRSSAINALEELEFETIDNLPISLIDKVATSSKTSKPLAIGLDIRNRDFSIQAIINSIAQLKTLPKIKATVLFVDCDPKTLNLRFSETRRKHPFAPQETIQDGIAHEIELLNPIKAKADLLIDTSDLTPHELRAQIKHHFDAWLIFACDRIILRMFCFVFEAFCTSVLPFISSTKGKGKFATV